jgi:hypothetical protein
MYETHMPDELNGPGACVEGLICMYGKAQLSRTSHSQSLFTSFALLPCTIHPWDFPSDPGKKLKPIRSVVTCDAL